MCSRRAATSTHPTARSTASRVSGLRPRCGRDTGPLLRLHVEAPVTVSCVIDGEDTPVEYTATVDFSLEVTDAVAVGDGWTATSLAYDRTADIEPGPDAGSQGMQAWFSDRERLGHRGEPGARDDRAVAGHDRRYSDDRFLRRLRMSSRRSCTSR